MRMKPPSLHFDLTNYLWFQEKVLKTESEYHERERLRIQNERELDRVRRQHEKEVYLLKKKLFEASSTAQDSGPSLIDGFHNIHHNQIQIAIPHFHLPSSDHVVFEVIITSKDATWTIFRRFRQFRDLHITQSSLYGATVTGLSFPSRRLFGNTSKTVSHQRQLQLQTYLNSLVQRCSLIPASPLYQSSCQAALVDFSDFFKPDAISWSHSMLSCPEQSQVKCLCPIRRKKKWKICELKKVIMKQQIWEQIIKNATKQTSIMHESGYLYPYHFYIFRKNM